MAERAAPRTLLEKIIRDGDRTQEEWCRKFDDAAREMRESVSLSIRQLHRWMAGELGRRPHPAARRVAAQLWGLPLVQLLGPVPVAGIDQPKGAGETQPESGTAVPKPLDILAIMAAHESTEHATEAGGGVSPSSIEQVQAEVLRLARRYGETSPLVSFAEARRARNLAYATLDRTRRPAQTADLYLAAGQLCGLMAVASFDLAAWDAAAEQARAAHVYGELVDHAGLRAWARGTQALIEYWTGSPRQALVHIEAGLDRAPTGAAQARLRSLEARAYSQLGGDPNRALTAISAADQALESDEHTDDLHDEIGGEFGWGPSRHAACNSTALLALGDAAGAAERARMALTLLPSDPTAGLVRERAHIDLASARLALNDLDSARNDLEPVWELPIAQRRHGLTDRLSAMARTLTLPRWSQVPEASELRDRIEVFNTEAQGRVLPAG